MKIEISVVRQILIPLSKYPYIGVSEPISSAIALLLANHSEDTLHLHYEDLLVVDEAGQLVGQLSVELILERFFRPALRPSASKLFYEGNDHYSDLIVVFDNWLKEEYRRQSEITIDHYITQQPFAVDASVHVVHALGVMMKRKTKVLPVTEDNVLLGAVRVEDIFKILGNCCFPPKSTANRIFNQGRMS